MCCQASGSLSINVHQAGDGCTSKRAASQHGTQLVSTSSAGLRAQDNTPKVPAPAPTSAMPGAPEGVTPVHGRGGGGGAAAHELTGWNAQMGHMDELETLVGEIDQCLECGGYGPGACTCGVASFRLPGIYSELQRNVSIPPSLVAPSSPPPLSRRPVCSVGRFGRRGGDKSCTTVPQQTQEPRSPLPYFDAACGTCPERTRMDMKCARACVCAHTCVCKMSSRALSLAQPHRMTTKPAILCFQRGLRWAQRANQRVVPTCQSMLRPSRVGKAISRGKGPTHSWLILARSTRSFS